MSQAEKETSRTTSRPKWGTLIQLLVVIGFLAVVWFSFVQNVLAPAKPSGVPERLGGLELVSRIQGPEALAQISKLHGTDIKLVTAYIAEYAHGNQRVTVWVAGAENGEAAAELTRRMIKGIEKGGSPFSNLQRLTMADQDVFQVEGPGGKNFFYNHREPAERVVWLAIEGSNTMPLLEQAVKTF